MRIATVHDVPELAADELGGKGAGLAALERLGLPVPRWITLPASFCDRVLARADPTLRRVVAPLAEGPADRGRFETAAAEAARAIETAADDPAWRAEIAAAVAAAFPGDARLAVRSSAVDEDSADASFAGQLRTFLAVPPADVPRRAAACLASAYGAGALLYRRVRGHPLAGVRAAVVVQQMVEARAAGVLFTANPTNGDRGEAVVSAALGLGEGVVQGEAADTFLVDVATGEIRHRVIAEKRERIAARSGGGTGREPVDPAAREAPALADDEVRALVALGTRIAEAAGAPQDVEWAVDAGGALRLLQARPVTALGPGRETVFDSANIVESYPGLTSPLTFTFVRPAYATTFLAAARALGVPEDVLTRERPVFENLVALVDGRVYYGILGWYRLYQLVPGFEGLLPAWERALGLRRRFVPPPPRARGLARLHRARTQVAVAARMLRVFRSLEREAAGFMAALAEERARLARVELDALDAHALLDELAGLAARLNARYAVAILNDLFTFQLYALLERLLRRAGVASPPAARDALLCAERGMDSVLPARSARGLAALARAEPAVSAILLGPASAGEAWAALAREPAAARFRDAVATHVAELGDRTLEELKLETPGLAEDPALLVTAARNALAAGEDALAAAEARERELRAAAEHELEERLRGRPLLGAVLRLVLERCRRGVRLRENLRLARARAFGLARRCYRALGRRLVADGMLDAPADLFWLTVEEADGAVRGHAVTGDLRALVGLRRAEWKRHARRPPAPRLVVRGAVHARPFEEAVLPAADARGVLTGIGCCPGTARGAARVVTAPGGDVRVAGEILVAPTTDPGWVFLMVAARGLVSERGSPLSHTAIIGRELGIPTVVGVAGATRLIADGEPIELDGRAGTVRRLGGAAGRTDDRDSRTSERSEPAGAPPR